MTEDEVFQLCTLLVTIDVIHYPEFKISCFEFVNGYTFEQSQISNTPQPDLEETFVPPEEDEEDNGNTLSGGEVEEEKSKDHVEIKQNATVTEEEIKPRVVVTTTSTTTTPVPDTDSSDNGQQTSGNGDQDLMNQILLSECKREI